MTLSGTLAETSVILENGWNLVSPLYGEEKLPEGSEKIWYWSSSGNKRFLEGDKATPGTGYWLFLRQ